MPKCSCAGSACNCNITVGDGLTVSGTGNANSPFVISLTAQSVPVTVTVAGPVDLSALTSGAVAYLSLSANVTNVTLPTVVGARIDVIVRHVVAGTTITFPSPVIWAGGNEPAEASGAGAVDWYTLRYVGDFWVGALLAGNAT